MMGKNILALFIGLIAGTNLSAQTFADFETTATTPDISAAGESKVLANPFLDEINTTANTAYYEKLAGNWQYVSMLFPDTIFIEKNNTLQFLSHASTQGRIYVKFWKGTTVLDEDWGHEYNSQPVANKWVLLSKDITHLRGEWFTKLEIAFSVDNEAVAGVYFDEFSLAKLTKKSELYYVVESGNAFSESMVEGTQLGEFPVGSKAELDAALTYAASILKIQDDVSLGYADSAAFDMNNTLTMIEATAIKHPNTLIDPLVSFETVNLYKNLNTIAQSKHQLFGSHDASAYGINEDGNTWSDDGTATKSDLKEVTGSHGAISSYDASEIVGKTFVEKANYRNRLIRNYEEGGVNTICWHMNDPKHDAFYWDAIEAAGAYNVVESINEGGEYHDWYKGQLYTLASFFKGLRGSKGEAIPIIFRPYHEHTGAWFWWGKTRCSTEEYNQLWQFTIHYLRDELNVHNVIYAYSPDASTLKDVGGYFQIYPGDDFTDIFGLDYYFTGGDTEEAHLTQMLSDIVTLAKEKNKIAALTETGNDMIIPNTWYTQSLLSAIHGSELSKQIAYYATWRNGSTGHFYVPYPGHSAVPDFLQFYDDTTTLFMNDMLEVYKGLLTNEVRLPSSGSRLNEFGFENDEGVQITDTNIWVLMAEDTELSELTALFKASQGASVTVDDVLQERGMGSNDFTTDLVYTIISESVSTTTQYKVTVDYSELEEMLVSPSSARLTVGESKQFGVTGYNQLANEMMVEPDWRATGGGSIDADGLFTASEEGNFEVIATHGELNAEARVKISANETAIDETNSVEIRIYPNPSNGQVMLETKKVEMENMKVHIYNQVGQSVLDQVSIEKQSGSSQILMDMSTLNHGIYYIQVVLDGDLYTQKLIINE